MRLQAAAVQARAAAAEAAVAGVEGQLHRQRGAAQGQRAQLAEMARQLAAAQRQLQEVVRQREVSADRQPHPFRPKHPAKFRFLFVTANVCSTSCQLGQPVQRTECNFSGASAVCSLQVRGAMVQVCELPDRDWPFSSQEQLRAR